MKKENKIKIMAQKKMVQLAKFVAKVEANSACPLIAYQPSIPKEMKNLRGF